VTISTFQSMCEVPNMAVFFIAVFFSSLMLCFPGLLVRYFVNDIQVVPVARISTGMTCFNIPHALLKYSRLFH